MLMLLFLACPEAGAAEGLALRRLLDEGWPEAAERRDQKDCSPRLA